MEPAEKSNPLPVMNIAVSLKHVADFMDCPLPPSLSMQVFIELNEPVLELDFSMGEWKLQQEEGGVPGNRRHWLRAFLSCSESPIRLGYPDSAKRLGVFLSESCVAEQVSHETKEFPDIGCSSTPGIHEAETGGPQCVSDRIHPPREKAVYLMTSRWHTEEARLFPGKPEYCGSPGRLFL